MLYLLTNKFYVKSESKLCDCLLYNILHGRLIVGEFSLLLTHFKDFPNYMIAI